MRAQNNKITKVVSEFMIKSENADFATVLKEFQKWVKKNYPNADLSSETYYTENQDLINAFLGVLQAKNKALESKPTALLIDELSFAPSEKVLIPIPFYQVVYPYVPEKKPILIFYNNQLKNVEEWQRNALLHESQESMGKEFCEYVNNGLLVGKPPFKTPSFKDYSNVSADSLISLLSA